ncbi:hypothetical protein [Stenotrophomonas maltophilia]|uniref:hypothetical protein n=1 Tax=Stenotrophomonas maltophilia TaxID=40324 RepID=UPI0003EA6D6C|nr:hypothetical protein [Stenotrophomonas maltophilia]EVT69463.1 hypothetical protein X548_16575 [Stenotrophomonas maltophilia 5BA-I-2]MDT3502583.1 hypothetical protein [Stenotrophomonas maltophilia]
MTSKWNRITEEDLARHLPAMFDFTLVTLKGHLLIEASLDDYIRSMLEKPSALLDKTRLQFDVKVKLAHALSGDNPPPVLWTAIDNLNKIRNSLAHRLNDDNLQNLRTEFVRLAKQVGFEPIPEDDEDEAYLGAISFLAGVLSGMLMALND